VAYIIPPTKAENVTMKQCVTADLYMSPNVFDEIEPIELLEFGLQLNFDRSFKHSADIAVKVCASSSAIVGAYFIVHPFGKICVEILMPTAVPHGAQLAAEHTSREKERPAFSLVPGISRNTSIGVVVLVWSSMAARTVRIASAWGEVLRPPYPILSFDSAPKGWERVQAYHVLYEATTPCNVAFRHLWRNLSFVQLQSFEPCVNESSLAGRLIGDFSLVEEKAGDDKDTNTLTNITTTKRWCTDDGLNVTGSEEGSWTKRSDQSHLDVWEPLSCSYQFVSRRELERFTSRISIFIWGDSISALFADMLRRSAFRSNHKVTMRKLNADGQSGLGLASLFAQPSSLLLGERWRVLLEDIHASDIIVLNSGLHDLAPYHNLQYGWHGDKVKVFEQYERRIYTLFQLFADDNHSRNGLSTRERIIWRTTTYPHIFWDRRMDHGGSAWYSRCDTQRLSVSSVKRLNEITVTAGQKYGIAIWDVSPMSIAATSLHAADGVHPSELTTAMWANIFYRHSVTKVVARAVMGEKAYAQMGLLGGFEEAAKKPRRRKRSDAGASAGRRKSIHRSRIAPKKGSGS